MSSSLNNTNNSSKTYKRYLYIDVQISWKTPFQSCLVKSLLNSFILFKLFPSVSTEKRAHAFRKVLALNKYYIYNLPFFRGSWLINLGATLSRHVPRRVQIGLILNGKNFFVILVIARAIRTATLSLAISEIFGCFFSFYSFRTHSLLPSMRLHYTLSAIFISS